MPGSGWPRRGPVRALGNDAPPREAARSGRDLDLPLRRPSRASTADGSMPSEFHWIGRGMVEEDAWAARRRPDRRCGRARSTLSPIGSEKNRQARQRCVNVLYHVLPFKKDRPLRMVGQRGKI